MRIIAGTARRLAIVTPEGPNTRPTGDRVREGMFNSLGSAGLIEDLRFVDLFAGSGALGLEVLSRGASHVTFVDSDRRAIQAIEENVESLGFEDRSVVKLGDGTRMLLGGINDAHVALLDPPYEFDEEQWEQLLGNLETAGIEAVVIESNRPIAPGPAWDVLKEKAYGGTVVVIAKRANLLEGTGDTTP